MFWGVVLTVLLTGVVTVTLSKIGPIDTPRQRGLSGWTTATAGGLAMIAGVCAGTMLFVALELPPPGLGVTPWLLLGACLVGLLGAIDDVIDVKALPKLIVQVVVALAFCGLVSRVEILPIAPGLEINLGFMLGVLGTALWMVVMINAYNFMDGSDGVAVGAQAIGLFTLALVNPDRPILAFVLLSASMANLAFLPYNHPGKRIFQGDCGALFSSFLIAGASVLLATGPNPRATMYLGAFVAAPFLVDVLLTLLKRARARRPLFQAHDEHLYQRWITVGNRGPGALAWRVWLICAASSAIGIVVNQFAPDWSLVALLSLIAALTAAWFGLSAQLDKQVLRSNG